MFLRGIWASCQATPPSFPVWLKQTNAGADPPPLHIPAGVARMEENREEVLSKASQQ